MRVENMFGSNAHYKENKKGTLSHSPSEYLTKKFPLQLLRLPAAQMSLYSSITQIHSLETTS